MSKKGHTVPLTGGTYMADKNFLTDIIDADLAEGKVQQIHTCFLPEPNGYLHIGSAKAIYINWSIANQYGGKFNLRLTTPTLPAKARGVCQQYHRGSALAGCRPQRRDLLRLGLL